MGQWLITALESSDFASIAKRSLARGEPPAIRGTPCCPEFRRFHFSFGGGFFTFDFIRGKRGIQREEKAENHMEV